MVVRTHRNESVMLMLYQQHGIGKIAMICGITKPTVKRWLNEFDIRQRTERGIKMIKQFKEDLKAAMKNKDEVKRDTIRLFLSMLDQERVKLKLKDASELTEDQILTCLNRQKSQLEEEIKAFQAAGKVAPHAPAQLDVIMSYLPAQLSVDEIKAEVAKVIEGGANNIGAAMGKLKHLKGKADMKLVNQFVREAL